MSVDQGSTYMASFGLLRAAHQQQATSVLVTLETP